ncbi:MAG TPA: hypothetical protein VM754_00045 [Actinomycetota bacterium]|nr:hypothetical protein [Actinomycetota bacterium]
MLTLSEDATQAIKQVLATTETAESGGIRFSIQPMDEDRAKLELSVAASPQPGDTQIEQAGANVFLDERVVPFLDNKLLDAKIESGEAAFTILDQPGEAAL